MPPVINIKKCSKCGICAEICTMDVFSHEKKGIIPIVKYPDECWHCRACIMDCKAEAILLRIPLPYRILAH